MATFVTTLEYLIKNDNLAEVIRRYTEMVDPKTGNTIPYSYVIFKRKNSRIGYGSSEKENRERALWLAACDRLKKDGVISRTADTNFYDEWSTEYANQPCEIEMNDSAFEKAGFYAGSLEVKYYEIRTVKPDEIMNNAEIMSWYNVLKKRAEKEKGANSTNN